jgi:hypothetical protein
MGTFTKMKFGYSWTKQTGTLLEDLHTFMTNLVTLPRLLVFLWLLCLPYYYGYYGECYH